MDEQNKVDDETVDLSFLSSVLLLYGVAWKKHMMISDLWSQKNKMFKGKQENVDEESVMPTSIYTTNKGN